MGKLILSLEVRECRDDSFTEELALILDSRAKEDFDTEGAGPSSRHKNTSKSMELWKTQESKQSPV